MRSLLVAVLLLVVPAATRADNSAVGSCVDAAAPYAEVQIDTYPRLNLEIARTPAEHEVGLMFRSTMPASDGMLFIFEQPGQQCFWMRNTLIPLSVAFIGDDGSVVNIDDMKPQTLDSHCSAKPVRFVLEMNEGWFAKRGIKAGSRLRGGPFAP